MLKGKVVLVTGGAGLIGSEFCRAIAAAGGTVAIGDRAADTGEALARELPGAAFFPLDITSPDSVQKTLDAVVARFGNLDAVVNNAYPRNAHYGRDFFEVEYADFCENVSLHLGGYFLVAQKAAALFFRQGHGNIVNMSSIYGVIPPRFEIYEGTGFTMPVEYAAIKSAVVHLTKFMAKRFKGQKIRVNAISPGGVYNQQPEKFVQAYAAHCLNKGMLDRTGLNGTLLYLLSDLSLGVNGQNIIVDDGFSL